MDRALRIDRIAPLEAASASLGLGLFLVWFSLAPSRALASLDPILLPSFLFVFAVCCTLLARTRLPGAGSFARTIWLTPCLLLPLPVFGALWGPLKALALLLTAFGTALMLCRWLTLCARFSPRLFLLLYCLSSLAAMTRKLPLLGASPLLHALPFLSTGLLLAAVRGKSWLPEGERYAPRTLSPREGLGLFTFALLLNGVQRFSGLHISRAGLVSPDTLQNAAELLSLAGLSALTCLRKSLSYRNLLAGALALWASGAALAGISVPTALFLVGTGCTLFELSFWLLMLQFAVHSPNPARMVCTGASLIAFAMLASRALLDLLTPIGANALSAQNGLVLFIGLASALFIFLPNAVADVPAAASAAMPEPASPPPDIPPAATDADRELRLKGAFESLGLTRQECRIALMVLDGADDTALCGELFISKNTLKFHIRNINRKLGIATRRDLPSLAERLLSGEGE